MTTSEATPTETDASVLITLLAQSYGIPITIVRRLEPAALEVHRCLCQCDVENLRKLGPLTMADLAMIHGVSNPGTRCEFLVDDKGSIYKGGEG